VPYRDFSTVWPFCAFLVECFDALGFAFVLSEHALESFGCSCGPDLASDESTKARSVKASPQPLVGSMPKFDLGSFTFRAPCSSSSVLLQGPFALAIQAQVLSCFGSLSWQLQLLNCKFRSPSTYHVASFSQLRRAHSEAGQSHHQSSHFDLIG